MDDNIFCPNCGDTGTPMMPLEPGGFGLIGISLRNVQLMDIVMLFGFEHFYVCPKCGHLEIFEADVSHA